MRAVRCCDGGVEVVDVPAPTGEGVRVRVRSAGICGSDLHMVGSDVFPIQATLGHEFAGLAEDGTAVAIEPLQPCGECAACGRGDYQRCVGGPSMVMGTVLDGGMAAEVVVPARCLVRLPGGLRVAASFWALRPGVSAGSPPPGLTGVAEPVLVCGAIAATSAD